MENFSIYKDIAERTNGDIYVGIVGPVRCGKSTFITNFMQKFVVPNIKNKHIQQRTIDELPQSADGVTIMTTQPKFVPNNAVKINLDGKVEMNVRMIDSVGYLVDGAIGDKENEKPRLVKTPWNDKEIPFAEAARFGTKKIIEDHSTIGVVMTSDGTINELDRNSYAEAEEKVIEDIRRANKPFVILINSKEPTSSNAQTLRENLEKKYKTTALVVNALEMEKADIENIFEKILLEFPIKSLKVEIPEWMQALPFENDIIQNVITEIKQFSEDITKIGQIDKTTIAFSQSEDFEPIGIEKISLGDGAVEFKVAPKSHLFYKVLSQQCGEEIKNDFHLVSYIRGLSYAKKQYEKLERALLEVEQTGYGVVSPTIDDMVLEDPKIVKQGSKFGVKLKATAPSLHIMKIDVETEISPLVGTQEQSQDMVKYLTTEFETKPETIWETNMFGKSLSSLVSDGIHSKIVLMPTEAQQKMRKTLTRIVNEGKGGVICILL